MKISLFHDNTTDCFYFSIHLFSHSDARSPDNIGFFLCLKTVQIKQTADGFEHLKLSSSKAVSSEHERNSVKIANNAKKITTIRSGWTWSKAIFRPPNNIDFENGCSEILIKFWFYSKGWSKVTKGCYYQTLWVNAVKIKRYAIGKKRKDPINSQVMSNLTFHQKGLFWK